MNQRAPLYDPYINSNSELFKLKPTIELGHNHRRRVFALMSAMHAIENCDVAQEVTFELPPSIPENIVDPTIRPVVVDQDYINQGIAYTEAYAQGDGLDAKLKAIGYTAPTIEKLNQAAQDATLPPQFTFHGENA